MQRSAASDLGLHFLKMSHQKGARLLYMVGVYLYFKFVR